MDIAALVAWIATAGGGFYLLGTWLAKGGMSRNGARSTRFPPALILGHAGLAAAGLLVWIGYLVSDESEILAWVAVGALAVVALLGFTMFFRWLGERRQTSDEATSGSAEQRFPVVIVGAHGVLAVATVVLVLVAAIGATG